MSHSRQDPTPAELTNRRRFLTRSLVGGTAFAVAHSGLWVPGAFAEELTRTPALTEGPFYPDKMPLDRDNDLIILGDSLTPAVGEVTDLTGRVLTSNGSPVSGVTVEIWQCDANGVYLHTRDSGRRKAQQDQNFQGYGHFTTGKTGAYRFRTIKPVQYPGRPAPHIHVKLMKGDRHLLTTQLFVRGVASNNRDGIFRSIRDGKLRDQLLVDFKPNPKSKAGELMANFDIVLG